jgi:hypothetical protein
MEPGGHIERSERWTPTVTVWETVTSGIEKVVDRFDGKEKWSYNLNRSCKERSLIVNAVRSELMT